jgi:hypothetical protein
MGTIISIFVVFTFFITYRHVRDHTQENAEHFGEEPLTRAQMTALRDWTRKEIAVQALRQQKEMRAQRRWTQQFVSERLREHVSFME